MEGLLVRIDALGTLLTRQSDAEVQSARPLVMKEGAREAAMEMSNGPSPARR